MAEKTGEQLPWGFGGEFGGTLGGNVLIRTESGTTLLPPIAATLGSGSLEGKNPYAPPCGPMGAVGFGFQLPGYGMPMPGTYATYRIMMAHPTLALAMAAVVCPILASSWRYEQDDERAPEGARDLIERIMTRHRTFLLSQMLRAVFVGCHSTQPEWGPDDVEGAIVPTMFRPLIPDITRVLTDKGDLVGIENTGVKMVEPGSFIHHVHDREGTNWYGRGRLENARRQWANWLADDDQGYRLAQKAAGIVPYIGHPADNKALAPGEVNNSTHARNMGNALQRMVPIAYQNLAGVDADAIERNPDLAGKSMWSVGLLDMGNTGPSQAALTEKLRYRDQLLVRSMLRSERSAIEANTAGSRADAESHSSDIGDTDADLLHAAATDTINAQIIDPLLIENYGPKAKGTVYIDPVQLVDERKEMMKALFDAAMADPSMRGEFADRIDWMSVSQWCGIPLKSDAQPFDEMPTMEEKQDEAMKTQQAMPDNADAKP